MARETRPGTRGNFSVDYTALRADINNINPVVKATLRNAVPRNGQQPERDELQGDTTINPFKLQRLSNIISNSINSGAELRQITPYIDKAELIWSTILLYPNGKQDKTINYDTKPSKLKNAKMHGELLRRWDNYYTNDYKIEADLRPIVNDILWNTGSYTLFNLSRPGLDYLINGSEMENVTGTESYRAKAKAAIEAEFVQIEGKFLARNLGRFVRDPKRQDRNAVTGMEALFTDQAQYHGTEFKLFDPEVFKGVDIPITITDNPALLYSQKFNAVTRTSDVDRVMGTEDLNLIINRTMDKDKKKNKPKDPKATTQNLSEEQAEAISHTLFPNRNVGHQSIQFVKGNDTLKSGLYGRGLTWHVPSEAVIPVHIQGSNGKKQDFILLVDDDGNFLKNTADADYYQSTKSTKGSVANAPKGGSTDSLISNLKKIQEGGECDFDMTEFAEMSKAIIIRQFMSAVLSGKGDNISISIDEETNKIFLARLFKRQGVRCLYVPGESITYMALKYNKLGMGQSLTQLAKMHIARLAAFDLADAMANLEAAQPHTLMEVNVAKEDPDPAHTIAIARQVFFEANPRLHSILATAQLSVPQIVDALRESSLTVKINAGDNPHMPAPDINLSHMEKQNFKPVDQSSREEVLNKISNYFFLPRSWLDVVDGGENNFQIEALVEHQMLLNQGANWQEQLAEFIIDFERKHAAVNGPLLNELVGVIINNKKLWKPDGNEEIEGKPSDEMMVKMILNDFMNGLYCWLPTPSSTESTNKLKEKLDAINDLVEAWEELSGYEKMLEPIAKVLGLEDDNYNVETIKAAVKSVFLTEAFKRYNLPMPFDDIVSEGKGGGMASLINALVFQRANIGEFMAKYVIDVAGADKKMLGEHQKKIAKALTALAEVSQPDDQNGDNGDGLTPADDDALGGGDVPAPGDEPELDDDGNPIEEPETTEEEEEEPETEEEENEEEEEGPADGSDPSKNDPEENPFKG